VARPIGPESVANQQVLGTYLHGCFENRRLREAFVENVFEQAGVERPDRTVAQSDPFDRAAELVEPIDLTAVVPSVAEASGRDQ